MTPATTDDLMRLAAWAVRQWRASPDYQDILSEAYIAAWLGYRRAVAKGLANPLGIAIRKAKWAPREWQAKWHGRRQADCVRHRWRNVSLEVLNEVPARRFEDRLLDRLEHKELVRRVWEVCTPVQRVVLYRVVQLGETKRECAAALGITETAVNSRLCHALAKARELFSRSEG